MRRSFRSCRRAALASRFFRAVSRHVSASCAIERRILRDRSCFSLVQKRKQKALDDGKGTRRVLRREGEAPAWRRALFGLRA